MDVCNKAMVFEYYVTVKWQYNHHKDKGFCMSIMDYVI